MPADIHHLHRQNRTSTRPTRGPAELRVELAAMRDRLTAILDSFDGSPDIDVGAPRRAPDSDGPIVSLSEAAGAAGWSEQRTRRHIVAHNARHPHDRLGWQPGGLENGRWAISLTRWLRYVEHLVEHLPAGSR